MSTEREAVKQRVMEMLTTLLVDKGESRDGLRLDDQLYEGGLGLDSLDAATFSAMLETEYGLDPYATDAFPQTIDDVITFYDKAKAIS